MTDQQGSAIRRFVWQRIGIWLMGALLWIVSFLVVALFTPLWDRAVAIWQTPAQLDAIEGQVARLADGVARATGEDRVFREVPGLTYVAEPVYQGEAVVFNMVAERTRLGRDCVLRHSQSIFTDEINIPTPGQRRDAVRQIEENPTPLRPAFAPPPNLRPGRVTIYLILTYDCDGKLIFDRTSTAAFELLPGPRPD